MVRFVVPVGLIALVFAAASSAPAAAPVLHSVAAIDRFAAPYLLEMKAGHASGLYANFAGDGTRYIRYSTEGAYRRALGAFLRGTAPGGGSFVARTYRVAGSAGVLVTFDPGVQTSQSTHGEMLYDASGRLVRLHEDIVSYNGHTRRVRDAYFTGEMQIVDRTVQYGYAPTDAALRHPVSSRDVSPGDSDLPIYETRAKLPFAA